MPIRKTPPDPLSFDCGDFRHQVRMVHVGATQDASGQPVQSWGDPYRTTMASIRNLSGQELFQSDEFTSAAQVRIRTRWTDDNTVPGDRIFWQSHVYVVQIINNVLGRSRVLELQCLEINGAS